MIKTIEAIAAHQTAAVILMVFILLCLIVIGETLYHCIKRLAMAIKYKNYSGYNNIRHDYETLGTQIEILAKDVSYLNDRVVEMQQPVIIKDFTGE